jgi:hypothetical protein
MPWHLNSYTITNESANVCVRLGGKVEIVASYNLVQLRPIPALRNDSRSEFGEKKVFDFVWKMLKMHSFWLIIKYFTSKRCLESTSASGKMKNSVSWSLSPLFIPYLRYIRYVCVSTRALSMQVMWLSLARCSTGDVWHSFPYVFCCFFPLKKKVTWSGIRQKENLAGLQESGQKTWSVCVPEAGILHIFNFYL